MSDPFLNHKEPEEVFLPLDSELYARFYTIEMEGFSDDIDFYRHFCKRKSTILELGCGSGRITSSLAAAGHRIVGLDISPDMLARTPSCSGNPLYVCMDMTRMGFCGKFDHLLIPYNSLNLLNSRAQIKACLHQARELLRENGALLLQLYVPDEELVSRDGSRLFQFQIFQLPDDGGRLIKESLRCYQSGKKRIVLEERYRLRPRQGRGERQDFRHFLHLAAYSSEQWFHLLRDSGFSHISSYSDFQLTPFQDGRDSSLFLVASPL